MDTPLLRIPPPLLRLHLTITDTPLSRTPRYFGHATISGTPLLRTSRYCGHPTITDTPILKTEAISPAETTKKFIEAISGAISSDSSYYGITHTSCGPQTNILIVLLSFQGTNLADTPLLRRPRRY